MSRSISVQMQRTSRPFQFFLMLHYYSKMHIQVGPMHFRLWLPRCIIIRCCNMIIYHCKQIDGLSGVMTFESLGMIFESPGFESFPSIPCALTFKSPPDGRAPGKTLDPQAKWTSSSLLKVLGRTSATKPTSRHGGENYCPKLKSRYGEEKWLVHINIPRPPLILPSMPAYMRRVHYGSIQDLW